MTALGIAIGLLALLRVVAWRLGPAPTDWTCSKCGYLVRGLRSEICPECGSNLRRTGAVRIERRWRSLARHANLKRACNIGVPVLVAMLAYRAGPALLPPRWLVSLRSVWGTQAVIGELEILKAPGASWSEPVLRALLASDDPELTRFALDVVKARPVPVGGGDGLASDILDWQADTKRPWRNELGELFEVLADRGVLRSDLVDRYIAHALAAEACIQAPPLSNGQVTVLIRLQWRAARTASAYLIDPADAKQTPRGLRMEHVVRVDASAASRGVILRHQYGLSALEASATHLVVVPSGWRSESQSPSSIRGEPAAADTLAQRIRATFCVRGVPVDEARSMSGLHMALIAADEEWRDEPLRCEWLPEVAVRGLEQPYSDRFQKEWGVRSVECAYVASHTEGTGRGHFLLEGDADQFSELLQLARPGALYTPLGEPPTGVAVAVGEARVTIWAIRPRVRGLPQGWRRVETPIELVFQTCW